MKKKLARPTESAHGMLENSEGINDIIRAPCPIKVLCDNQAQDVGQFLQEEQGFKIITQSLKKEKKQRPCRRINWIRSCAEY